jgi:plasmid stabilization system protein ParE
MWPLILIRSARREFDDAVDWHEDQRAGLGTSFQTAVRHALRDIASDPYRWPIVYKGIRQSPVGRWSYVVCYRIASNSIRVTSIFHTSRDPKVWMGRR